MITTWKVLPLVLLFCLFLVITPSSADQESSKRTESNPGNLAKEASVSDVDAVLLELSNAINDGNISRTMSVWSEDALFVDETGGETRGKAAIESRFARLFAERGKDSLTLHPEKTNFPANNVAIVTGEVARKNGNVELPASRFTMVFVKQNQRWLINEATETLIQEKKAADQLKLVDWLVGNWTIDNPNASVQLEVKWSENRNLLLSKSASEKKDGSKTVDYQIIGFDPRTNGIVSWHFPSNGGFGYGKWSKENNDWLVDYAGVDRDGADTSARNIFSVKGDNEFTWQSIHQMTDGNSLPDTGVVTLQRSKK